MKKRQDNKSYSSYKNKKTYSLDQNQVLQLIKEKKFSEFLEEFNGAENGILDMLGTFGSVEGDVYFSLLDCIFSKYGNTKTTFYIIQTACDQDRLETSNYLLNKLLGTEGKICCSECLYQEERETLNDIVFNALKYNSTINTLTISRPFDITYLTKNLLDTLVHNKTITKLNVDGYCGENNKLIKNLQQALINSSVTNLNLNLDIDIDWNRDKIIDDLANLLSSSNISKFKFTGIDIFSDSKNQVRVDDLGNDVVQSQRPLSILGEETMACFDFLSAERPNEQLPDELVSLIAYHSRLLDIDSDMG